MEANYVRLVGEGGAAGSWPSNPAIDGDERALGRGVCQGEGLWAVLQLTPPLMEWGRRVIRGLADCGEGPQEVGGR